MRDRDEPVVITLCPDGPLLVRGDFAIAPAPGADPEPPRRNVTALCRCGMTAIPPLCDGSHRLSGFRTPRTASERQAESPAAAPGQPVEEEHPAEQRRRGTT
ncbi:CDGSH iron-sulfur domain-containing protein [Brevibacterium album]|uniref:CDGSH iron-sulfur domain-containing protein n=1 Tax=Brevibacterium album TaxID=417948 RepID=UPI0003FC1969|nr:CDGSH iron-sulfur domain-containing protein [Brevibacterium album]